MKTDWTLHTPSTRPAPSLPIAQRLALSRVPHRLCGRHLRRACARRWARSDERSRRVLMRRRIVPTMQLLPEASKDSHEIGSSGLARGASTPARPWLAHFWGRRGTRLTRRDLQGEAKKLLGGMGDGIVRLIGARSA